MAPTTAPTSLRPVRPGARRAVDEPRAVLPTGPPPASSRSSMSRRRGSRCARARTGPRPPRARRRRTGSSASRADVRADGQRVGARPSTSPNGVGVRQERLGVGARADVDVAALGVGEHEQARGAGVPATSPSARQPGAPRRSKHATCGLTATQAGPGAQCDHAPRRAAAASRRRPRHAGPQPRRVGVEPEDDLGLALRPTTPPVEPARRRRGSRRRLTAFLSVGARGELRDLRGGDLDRLAGARVHALAGVALRDVELAEAGEGRRRCRA